VIAEEPTTGTGSGPRGPDAAPRTPDRPAESVSTLRGAAVEVNTRRVAHLAVGVVLVTLAVLGVALFVAGANKNAQITRLREHGVAVEITVSGCQGLLGGSGSNAAGYVCRGTFRLADHEYNELIPGDTFHAPGSTLQGITVPGDPALVSTAAAVAAERASWRVFIVPAVLLAGTLLLGAVVLRLRSASSLRVRRARS